MCWRHRRCRRPCPRRCASRSPASCRSGSPRRTSCWRDRPDRRLRRQRPRDRVRRARDRGALDGGTDDGLQHVDRGGRACRDDRARTTSPSPISRAVPACPTAGPGSRRSRRGAPPHRRRRDLRPRGRRRRLESEAAGHVGHEPRDGRASRRRRSRPVRLRRPRRSAKQSSARLPTWTSTPGTPLVEHSHRQGVHRLVHERTHRGPARRPPPSSPASRSQTHVHAIVVPGSAQVKQQAEDEGLRRDLHGSGLRVAPRRLLDVPRDEPRRARPRRPLRLDVEPQLRGAAGRGRRARTSSVPRWRPPPPSPGTSPTAREV